MRRRTILSVIRTIVYACLTIILALWHGEIKGNTEAILVGGMWGDYLTWLIWSVIELPEDRAWILRSVFECTVSASSFIGREIST